MPLATGSESSVRTAIIAGVLGGMVWAGACSSVDDMNERMRGNPVLPLPTAGTSSLGTAGTGLAGTGAPLPGGSSVGPAGRSGAAGAPMVTMPVPPPPAGRPAPPPAAGAAGAAVPPPAAGSTAPPPVATGDRATPEGVCSRWLADRADRSEGMWSGNVMSCDPGDTTGRANALRILNLYRWLADMPAVTTDPAMDKQAQACALMQRANGMLSHTPPMTWTCYMAEGATASGRCNISSGPGVASVDGYMVDPGNPTTIGHRRWILSNTFGPTGLGSTDRHSCMMTFGKMKVGKPWMAWPSPGIIPLQAMQGGFGQKVDSTGWTVQSDTINLAMAQVTVMSDGMNMPVTLTQLSGGYGSRYAFRFNPMGWSTTAGKTYMVSVTGTPTPINYSVQIVDCK
jgi:uncharacterized protein YkwD